MAWVEKDHNAHLVPTPLYVQGRQPAAQAAQSHIQSGLECLQGWGIHSLLGQPVSSASLPNAKLFPGAAGRFRQSHLWVTKTRDADGQDVGIGGSVC